MSTSCKHSYHLATTTFKNIWKPLLWELWHYVLLVDDHKKCQRQTVRVSKGINQQSTNPWPGILWTDGLQLPPAKFQITHFQPESPISDLHWFYSVHVSRSHSKIWLWRIDFFLECYENAPLDAKTYLCVKLYPMILEKEFITECIESKYSPNFKIPFFSRVTIFLGIFSQPWSFELDHSGPLWKQQCPKILEHEESLWTWLILIAPHQYHTITQPTSELKALLTFRVLHQS